MNPTGGSGPDPGGPDAGGQTEIRIPGAQPEGKRLHGCQNRLILVVDDDGLVRSVLSRLLRAEGFDVVEEATGVDALESLPLLRPDLVLLDIMMPGMNGLDVCRALKSDPATRLIPVLLLTGLANVEDKIRGLEAGADDFLSKPPDRLELLARVKSLLRMKSFTDQLVSAESVVLALARSIEGKDPHTEGHCERLSAYATQLGSRLGLGQDDLDALHYGGFLHDIGKVAVPDAVLLKNGPLTPDEWALMKRHPLTGEHVCSPVHTFRNVLPIIRHHHERQDGTGYPDGLSGSEIPITARVLQTVDVFDALTSDRPYCPAMSWRRALDEMASEVGRGWWDPVCFAAFERMVRENPGEFVVASPPEVRDSSPSQALAGGAGTPRVSGASPGADGSPQAGGPSSTGPFGRPTR